MSVFSIVFKLTKKTLQRGTRCLILLLFFNCLPALAQQSVNSALELLATGDTEASLSILQQLAKNGDAQAQSSLGDIYEQGQYVPQNYKTAVYWRKLAAAQKHSNALNALGRHYAEGIGIDKDNNLAMQYLKSAAKNSDASHQYDLALFLDQKDNTFYDPAEAALWYERAAQQGLVSAKANLGLLYYLGQGVALDYKKAFEYFSEAAELGHANAQNNLGLLYTRGHGVTLDYTKASFWFQAAVEQGLAQAMTNMGVMYENGFGVEQNDEKAKQLYILGGQKGGQSLAAILAEIAMPYDSRLAPLGDIDNQSRLELNRSAKLGDPLAAYQLGFLLSQGSTANYTLAAKWYSESTRLGMREAMLNLGLLYMNGLGVAQDYVLGYHWILQAAAQGSAAATQIRGRLLSVLTPEQINLAQAMQDNKP